MEQNFLVKDVEVEFYGDKKSRYKSKTALKWSLTLYFRDYGIQEAYVRVPDQEIKVTSIVEVEVGDDTEDQEIEETFQVQECKVDLDSISLKGAVLPQVLEISFRKGNPTFEVKF